MRKITQLVQVLHGYTKRLVGHECMIDLNNHNNLINMLLFYLHKGTTPTVPQTEVAASTDTLEEPIYIAIIAVLSVVVLISCIIVICIIAR